MSRGEAQGLREVQSKVETPGKTYSLVQVSDGADKDRLIAATGVCAGWIAGRPCATRQCQNTAGEEASDGGVAAVQRMCPVCAFHSLSGEGPPCFQCAAFLHKEVSDRDRLAPIGVDYPPPEECSSFLLTACMSDGER